MANPAWWKPPPNRRAPGPPPAAERLAFCLVSLALLLPCFWQPRIQAGDLASHVYNAWLADQIQQGKVTDLAIVPVWTNVLSDWLLEFLMKPWGPEVAEKAVVAGAVLVFFWGAFALGAAVAGRRPWILAPSLAMLAYGLLFHMGFLNYYVSVGLALWVLALLWRPAPGPRRWLVAAAISALAVLAHAVPLAWAGLALAYVRIANRLQPVARLALLAGAGILLLGVRSAIVAGFPVVWVEGQVYSLDGIAGLVGVDQVWLFGPKYLYVVAGLLVIWCTLFLDRLDREKLLTDPIAGLWLLHMAAFAMMPAAILLPGYAHTLAYLPQRISLFTALLLCLLTAQAGHGKGVTRASVLVCAVFFTFLYMDASAFSGVERELEELLKGLPPNQSVAASLVDADGRVNSLAHAVDRACIGRCYSYGNYEPATLQFRIRAAGQNRMAAPDMAVVKAIEEGRHLVLPHEAPLYSLCLCDGSDARLCLKRLEAGARTCRVSLTVTNQLGAAWFPRGSR